MAKRYLYRPVNWDVISFFRRQHPPFFPIGTDVAGGPIRRAGFYVTPCCSSDCCRPEGPFHTIRAARRHSLATARQIEREHWHWSRYRAHAPSWRMRWALGFLWRQSVGRSGRRH